LTNTPLVCGNFYQISRLAFEPLSSVKGRRLNRLTNTP